MLQVDQDMEIPETEISPASRLGEYSNVANAIAVRGLASD